MLNLYKLIKIIWRNADFDVIFALDEGVAGGNVSDNYGYAT